MNSRFDKQMKYVGPTSQIIEGGIGGETLLPFDGWDIISKIYILLTNINVRVESRYIIRYTA